MKDSKDRAVFPPMTEGLSGRIAKLSRASEIRIFILIYSKIMIYELELIQALRLKSSQDRTYQKDIIDLCRSKMIIRYVDESRKIIYSVHSDIIIEGIECAGCKHASVVTTSHDFKEVSNYECNAKFSCAYNYYRVAQGVIKRYRLLCGLEPSELIPNSRAKHGGGLNPTAFPSDFNSWKIKHMVEFVVLNYKKHYPSVLDIPNKSIIHKVCVVVRKMFEYEFVDWQYNMRIYIAHCFERAIESKEFLNVYSMKNTKEVFSFIKSGHTLKVQMCQTYDIYCPYWKVDKCKLVEAQSTCTSKLRKEMLKAYN